MRVQVIVVPCVRTRVYGDRILDMSLDNLVKATMVAMPLRSNGLCVIIRPLYNEKGFFREWRSFDGSNFQECRWTNDIQ